MDPSAHSETISFPEAGKKAAIPAFTAYPIGYELIRAQLEPHLPPEPFELHYYGLDQRLAKNPKFNTIEIFRLTYLPAKPRHQHWSLALRAALRKDKPHIRSAMIDSGFILLIEFLTRARNPIWKDLSFSRALVWNSIARQLDIEDHKQIDV